MKKVEKFEPKILIVDLGSQYALLIARLLRECGYRSVVLSPKKAGTWIDFHKPQAVILSGSDKSVYDDDAPQPPANSVDAGIPILGICYGMQWFAKHLGGDVARDHDHVEYGPAGISFLDRTLFAGIDREQQVWASHGDSVLGLPQGIEVIATDSNGGGIRAMYAPDQRFWGVQFHPEVPHTPCGKQILTNFVHGICGCKPDWEPVDIVASIRSKISTDPSVCAVLGFSGGVDSTTMAAILAPALGDRLLGVCIDGGHLREGELEEIECHAKSAGIILKVVNAKAEFLEALNGVTDAEKKRHIFKHIYLRLLKKAVADFDATHVVQGTLATDEIESGATGGHIIKSHHNVGLDWGNLGELKPLSSFFKYEVRALAQELDLPDSVINREPFPGPGLFLRVFGECVTEERLDVVRWADHQVRLILRDAENVPEISQLVVALCCVDTTGVKGDARVYKSTIVIRSVHTSDFMTADAVEFPVEVRRLIKSKLTRHPEVVRVWWDETDKPPATTEFE